VTASEIVDHCRARLAGYKKPRYLAFVSELPRNATSKVTKERIREMLASGEITAVPSAGDGRPSEDEEAPGAGLRA
jgi:acyl-CoA synthetase (AMP-forming)/AMP-acid ligase II